MRIAYVDCSAGAAGDMLLAALIDAGATENVVRESLAALDLPGWDLSFEETDKRGLRALRARVGVTDTSTSRTYADIVDLLERAPLRDDVRSSAVRAFGVLAEAEGRVHHIDPQEVHFHEVGALDALVDIVGCCAAFTSLRLDRVIVSPIATGTGSVESAHGEIPLPAPAVTEIFAGTGAVLYGRGTQELITPTGAALLATHAHEFGSLPHLALEATGHGAGSADLGFPNIVRIMIGQQAASDPSNGAVVVETNIDDMSPELLPHVIARLIDAGAHDAWLTPIVMKKGRPAFTLSALCDADTEEEMANVMFAETTTLGMRSTRVAKRVLVREWVETEVAGARVRVKIGKRNGAITTVAPEHDDAVAAAKASGLPLKQVYARAVEQVTQENGTR